MKRDTDEPLSTAMSAHRSGRFEEAETAYRRVLGADPENSQATVMLGILMAQSDREEKAAELLSRAIELDPISFDALNWLSAVLGSLKRYREAIDAAERALKLRPNNPGTLLNLATGQFGLARYEAAARTFCRKIKIDPNDVPAYYGLASAYLKLGDPWRAREALRAAARKSPDRDTLLRLCETALACGDPNDAIACAKNVLVRAPGDVGALLVLARAHRNAHNGPEEERAISSALSVDPDNALAHALLGRRLQAQGQFGKAESAFRRSIELRPSQGVAYHGISIGRRITDGDAELVKSMELILADSNLSDDEQMHLRYALGKALDNLGRFGEALAQFDEGNRLLRSFRMGTREFDRRAFSKRVDQTIALFTPTLLKNVATVTETEPKPIFIAGMIRSGTTLAEQILSCHPLVGAGGEQSFWLPAERECVNYERKEVNSALVQRKAHLYAERLGALVPNSSYVTDKNPANLSVFGLIHLAFPEARIIHMLRNPVDVAISIYTTLMRTGESYIGDRRNIVFALKEQQRLERHWASVLPPDRLLQIRYSDLIRDCEATTRRMVEFCGLEWDDRCNHPEENLRTVVTPSFWQVRQPVYRDSLDRWRRYEPWLGAFQELVEEMA